MNDIRHFQGVSVKLRNRGNRLEIRWIPMDKPAFQSKRFHGEAEAKKSRFTLPRGHCSLFVHTTTGNKCRGWPLLVVKEVVGITSGCSSKQQDCGFPMPSNSITNSSNEKWSHLFSPSCCTTHMRDECICWVWHMSLTHDVTTSYTPIYCTYYYIRESNRTRIFPHCSRYF